MISCSNRNMCTVHQGQAWKGWQQHCEEKPTQEIAKSIHQLQNAKHPVAWAHKGILRSDENEHFLE
jgi:hypothetical protein